jgi:hypothetical protein
MTHWACSSGRWTRLFDPPYSLSRFNESLRVAAFGDFCIVRQAWRVARKRNQLGCGGHAGDLEVKVLYTPGKGKC